MRGWRFRIAVWRKERESCQSGTCIGWGGESIPQPEIPQPIVVVGVPRSGTSLVASIFAAHGVWAGRTREGDQYNPRGYFESWIWWKLIQGRENGGYLWGQLIYSLIRGGYRGGPWLIKHHIRQARFWREEFRPFWVVARRDDQSLVPSIRRVFAPEEAEEEIQRIRGYREAMKKLVQEEAGVEIWMEDLIEGRLTSLREAFDVCGISLNESLAYSLIDPKLEHWKNGSGVLA